MGGLTIARSASHSVNISITAVARLSARAGRRDRLKSGNEDLSLTTNAVARTAAADFAYYVYILGSEIGQLAGLRAEINEIVDPRKFDVVPGRFTFTCDDLATALEPVGLGNRVTQADLRLWVCPPPAWPPRWRL